MDINFKKEDIVFNYRVGALIKYQNQYLITEHQNKDYDSFIGGRVHLGEDSISAVIREVKEETGYTPKYIRTRGILENFFLCKGKEYHEIFILHELEFCDKEIYTLKTIKNLEQNDAQFVWKTKTQLNKTLEPLILIDYLEKQECFHLINKN